jgi:hypothetical protein
MRSWALGLSMLACAAVVAMDITDTMTALAGVVFVYLSCRSPFNWILVLPLPLAARLIIRRLLRHAVFFVVFPFLAVPPMGTAASCAMGSAAGAIALGFQWKEIRRSFEPAYLKLFPPIGAIDRTRDLITFGFAGAAQEYLYRYAVLVALSPLIGYASVLVAAVLFTVEHLIHPGGSWDIKDLMLQALLAIVLGTIVYVGGGLLPAVLGHTVFNLPAVLFAARRPAKRQTSSSEESENLWPSRR